MSDKIAVFADVHGKADQLEKLISKIRVKHSDIEIYSLGDLIDRGPNSREVIRICIREGIKANQGNHDRWLIDLVSRGIFDPFCIKPIMGGLATLESFDVDYFSDGTNYFPNGRPDADLAMNLLTNMTKEERDWIKSIPPYRKLEVGGETFWLLHAGLTKPNAALYKVKTKDPITYYSDDEMMERLVSGPGVNNILWPTPNFGSFGRPDNLFHFENAVQVFGHRPNKKPIIKPHFIAMDTGCGTCEPFTLSAIILPDREVISVVD